MKIENYKQNRFRSSLHFNKNTKTLKSESFLKYVYKINSLYRLFALSVVSLIIYFWKWQRCR